MGVFHHSSSHKNYTCPEHSLSEDAKNTIVGGLTFHQLNMIISGACAGLAIIIMLVFKQLHATHLSNPLEQVKIMRIGTLITMFALISFLSVCYPEAEVYIHPWLDPVEGFALGSFFLLLCDYVSPHQHEREAFFAAKQKNGLKWFKTRWFLIFQMPIVAVVVSILTDITAAAGVYCEWGSGLHFAKFWLRLIMSISLGLSVMSILKFYQLLKSDLAHHRPLAKLIAFKAIVFLTFVQGILFWILTDKGVLKATDTLTFADLNIGIPNLLLCIEMVPMSLFFTWAYPWKVYTDRDGRGTFHQPGASSSPYQGGSFGIKAWLAMFNPSDTLKAILFAFRQVELSRKAVGSGAELDENPRYSSQQPLYPRGPRDGY